MRKINTQFILTILLFSLYFVGGIVLLAYYYSKTSGSSVVVTFAFVILLLSILISSMANRRLNYLMNLSYQMKIRNNAGEPISLRVAKSEKALYSHLAKDGYKKLKRTKTHSSFYRVVPDDIKRIFSLNMLEVVVFVSDDVKEFFKSY